MLLQISVIALATPEVVTMLQWWWRDGGGTVEVEEAAPSSCHTNPCLNSRCVCPTGLFLTPKLSHAFWWSVPQSFRPPQPSSRPSTMYAFAHGCSDSLYFCPSTFSFLSWPLLYFPLSKKVEVKETLRENYDINKSVRCYILNTELFYFCFYNFKSLEAHSTCSIYVFNLSFSLFLLVFVEICFNLVNPVGQMGLCLDCLLYAVCHCDLCPRVWSRVYLQIKLAPLSTVQSVFGPLAPTAPTWVVGGAITTQWSSALDLVF